MDLWDKAKAKAKLLNKSDDWLYIYNSYMKMGGHNKEIIVIINNCSWKFIRMISNNKILTRNYKNEELILTEKEFLVAKKLFKNLKCGD